MRRPTQTEVFDALLGIAAADGRGAVLFGEDVEPVRLAFERSLIGAGYPDAYLEFPLAGRSCLDLLSVYGRACRGARFAAGAGFGRQDMFDWFADAGALHDVSVGLEVDTSVGETERAGAYLQQRTRTELVAPFLESIGEEARVRDCLSVLERMPKGWQGAYVGLFPGRPHAPLRIGGYLSRPDQRRCAADPAHLGRRLERIGFPFVDSELLERSAQLMRLAPSVDYQFDILPDGSLGPTFGLSLSLNQVRPREARACMETGYGAELMGLIQGWGLADERWRLLADVPFARSVDYVRDDGSTGHLALCVLFNYAKVKFAGGHAQSAKFYLRLRARELAANRTEEGRWHGA